jgi:hypothetical protein
MLAEKINKNEIFVEAGSDEAKDLLTQDLEQVKQYRMDSDSKRQVLPKDKVKEVLGRSPDYSDALMMRMWFELTPKLQYWAI